MPDQPTEQNIVGETADMLAVVALLLTVIYADGNYDAWDLALSIVAFVLSYRRLNHVSDIENVTLPRIVARFGVALAIFVIFAISYQAYIFLRENNLFFFIAHRYYHGKRSIFRASCVVPVHPSLAVRQTKIDKE
jgi:hypothetical protein